MMRIYLHSKSINDYFIYRYKYSDIKVNKYKYLKQQNERT